MKLLQLKLKIVSIRLAILKLMIRIFKLKRTLPSKPEEPISLLIRRIAKEYNVDESLAIKVAFCESQFNPEARSINRKGSVDRGLYQWNDYWHKEISDHCAYNPECATRRFCIAVKAGHLDWWNASRECWSR